MSSPKIRLHPIQGAAIRADTTPTPSPVNSRIEWSDIIELLRHNGGLFQDEDVEVFVIDQSGINIHMRKRT